MDNILSNLTPKLVLSIRASVLTPVIYFVENYIWNDWSLLISVFILLFLDGIALLFRAIRTDEYGFQTALLNFGVKTLSVVLILAALGVFENSKIKDKSIEFVELINYGCYTMVLTFLVISMLNNLYIATGFELLKKIIDKINNALG